MIGHITRRRSCGKNLAFADIQVEEVEEGWLDTTTSSHENDNIVKSSTVKSSNQDISIMFHRNSDKSVWNHEFDDTFPVKNSMLPYGGKVCVNLRKPVENNNFRVYTWELLMNPKEEALAAAKQDGTEGISCTVYLKSRADAYLRFNDPAPQRDENVRDSKNSTYLRKQENQKNESSLPPEIGEFSHGDNRAKSMSARIFASWLIKTYGEENLRSGIGVLDIAGGKGKLSIELAVQGKIPSTVVDPLVRKHGKKLEPKEAKRIRKVGAPHPNFVATAFNQTTFLEREESGICGEDLLANSSVCVGLHPDECTEDILDLALKHNRRVAIVPCCVFPGFFPLRTLRCGTAVRTYDQFLEYLLSKDERLQIESLPFEGKNKVIYSTKT